MTENKTRMVWPQSTWTHNRRQALKLAWAAITSRDILVLAFARGDFWNEKEASQWSEEERSRILTNSPWTRRASVSADLGGGSMGSGSDGGSAPMGGGGMGGGGMGGGGMGGMGEGGMGGGRGGMGGGGMGGGSGRGGRGGSRITTAAPKWNVLVRWESAEPVRRAGRVKTATEPDFYLIGVTGLKALDSSGRRATTLGDEPPRDETNVADRMERLQQVTKLEVKDQSPLHPMKVERSEDPEEGVLFRFERAELPITPASKEITFVMDLGHMVIRAKFSTREMVYHDRLSL